MCRHSKAVEYYRIITITNSNNDHRARCRTVVDKNEKKKMVSMRNLDISIHSLNLKQFPELNKFKIPCPLSATITKTETITISD